MRRSTERLLTALGVLAFFVLQFCWLAYSQASWGLSIPFLFTTTLISIVMPIITGISAAVMAWESASLSQRKLLYPVAAASVAEIVTFRAMLWFHQPLLMLAVFLLNAFMTVQLLRFGISWFLAKSDHGARAKPHEAVKTKTPAGKKTATVRGGLFRIGLVTVGLMAFLHLLYPSVPLTVDVAFGAALLVPGIIIVIFQRIWLRKSLSREGGQ